MDYGALNQAIILDKLFMAIVKELINELHRLYVGLSSNKNVRNIYSLDSIQNI